MSIFLKIILFMQFIAVIWYVPWRLKKLTGSPKRVLVVQIIGILALIVTLVTISNGMFASGSQVIAKLYLMMAFGWVFFTYVFGYLLVAHAVEFIFKKKINFKVILIVGVILCLSLTIRQLIKTQSSFNVREVVIPVPGLTSPVKVFHVVDLHLGAFRGKSYLVNFLKEVEDRQPDIIIYNGDLVTSNLVLTEENFDMFQTVKAEQYYSTGNHDYDIDTDRFLQLLIRGRIVFLRSKMIETHGFQLIGLEYMNGERNSHYDPLVEMVSDLTIEETLPKIVRNRDLPTILFHHSPVGLRHVVMGEIDVMLAGNTHSGQLSPVSSLLRLSTPRYSGIIDLDKAIVLVSRGGGNYEAWLWLGAPFEFELITLIPG
ncbi:MAG: metallophosphoesterase [Deltaproteobacteria bacterium]|jgi:predicted MPP superfamily phosphohydrolase|nr:metallophosphoesterase [Deltaproteobacteria bacterium]